ncbi:hypothetical protein B0A55_07156 [Friedmanniomyces simplex]|uniref:Uncharacterized protein n=1 Tax=Friedmanniomyces simplex TaxID=329884 RepID=A0A4U0X723_9PEZI|nr:hypothetical protein B0A55_07156 [Friedmanniomyces simplex]
MARYPAFEDYEQKRNFGDGIKRCNELLRKSPKNIQLLTTKLRLLYATGSDEAPQVLDEVTTLSPREIQDIVELEEAVVDGQSHVFPRPSTAGPTVTKIWDAAAKAATTTNQKLEVLTVRFERAVLDDRLIDAQQALIQLKAFQPRDRVVYMAHAAFTQLISTSNEDLQARLAMGLARKAVTERFDDDKALDCKVPGQIFAVQGAVKELESTQGRPFQDSKQVSDARQQREARSSANGTANSPAVPEPGSVPTQEWLVAEIRSLQQTFTALIEAGASTVALRGFTTSAIRLFHESISTLSSGARRSPAHICFLVISALVKMFEQTSDTQYLLHAAYLAESLLRHDEHIHEARLILVYLYMRLNLGSLAMRLFDSLSIKEIQHDTVGHALFTRLSLIHPHATSWGHGDADGMLPTKRTTHALSVYVRCEEKLAETQASVLNHGQTGMLFDLQGLRDGLRMSLSRRVTLLEHRRIARLTKGTIGEDVAVKAMGPLACENWVQDKDNRDFDAAFDYGYNVERALHGRGGAMPSKAWVLFALAADTAWCIATESSTMVMRADEIPDQIRKLKEYIDPQLSASKQASELGMTESEYLAGDVAFGALELLQYIRSAGRDVVENMVAKHIASIHEAIDRLSIDTLTNASDPSAECLLDHYAYADVLNIIALACQYARSRSPEGVARELQELQGRAKLLFARLQQHATEQQAAVKAGEVRRYMERDDGVWQELWMLEEERVQGFCGEVAKAAKEGWEGVLKIKLV